MKLLAAMGMVVLAAGAARAAYVVQLAGGKRLTVESYWEEGGRVHLMKGGVDLIYPKRQIVAVREARDVSVELGPATRMEADSGVQPARRAEPATPEELSASKERIEKHLLRVQAERFEAKARGEDPKTVQRLDREFRRTQARRSNVNRQLGVTD